MTTNPDDFFSWWRDSEPTTDTDTETITEEDLGYLTPIEENLDQTNKMATTAKEFTINKPTPFDGDRKEVTSFLQNCQAYLQVNAHIYTTDDSKVAFILSFMNEKEAKRWKENFYLTITNATNGGLDFPTFVNFLTTVRNDFKAANKTQDAEHQIAILQQGKRTAEEIITEF